MSTTDVVPDPMPARNGALVVEADAPGVLGPRCCGQHLGDELIACRDLPTGKRVARLLVAQLK